MKYPNFDVTLSIWDLAGQEQFSFVRSPFYRGANAFIYVFDLTRKDSLENLSKWKEEAMKVVGKKPCILVGNKLDLAGNGCRQVKEQDKEKFRKELEAFKAFETSAKDGIKIDDAFQELTCAVIEEFA